MGKIRRGNLVFVAWIGDHGDHVHVYKDGRQVAKYDLEGEFVISGRITARILEIIRELQREKRL